MGGMEPAYNGSYARRTVISNFLQSGLQQNNWQNERRIALRHGAAPVLFPQCEPGLADCIFPELTEHDLLAAEIVAEARPEPLRSFDQIPMLAGDLALQAKLVLPMLADKRVVFMGDNDGASLILGLMGVFGDRIPLHMLVLDFDQRIIAQAQTLAKRHGFADRFEARAYNAFDAVPDDLLGKFDVFYTNPPYGRANVGESAQLFITRGIELCHSKGGAGGCIILPDDPERLWTRKAIRTTEFFVLEQGWEIVEKINSLHHYHLPSDPGLTSGMLWTSDVEAGLKVPPARYAGRRVPTEEIEHFYGTKVKLPYPRYIRENGEYDCNWGG